MPAPRLTAVLLARHVTIFIFYFQTLLADAKKPQKDVHVSIPTFLRTWKLHFNKAFERPLPRYTAS